MTHYKIVGFIKEKTEDLWQEIHDDKGLIEAASIEEAYEILESIFNKLYYIAVLVPIETKRV